MNLSKRTWVKCFVPSCSNNSTNSRNKVFVHVRASLQKSFSEQVKVKYQSGRKMYCCEDHLKLQDDLENYYYFKLAKGQPKLSSDARLRLNDDDLSHVMPNLKNCLLNNHTKKQNTIEKQCKKSTDDENLIMNIQKPPKLREATVVRKLAQKTTRNDSSAPTSLEVCRTCLASDCKLFSMKDYNLKLPFENVTGIPLKKDDWPQHLCFECARRLINSYNFKDKSLKSNILLNQLAKKHKILSLPLIKAIDRGSHQLVSNLSQITVFNGDVSQFIKAPETENHLDNVKVKLEDNDPFLDTIEEMDDDKRHLEDLVSEQNLTTKNSDEDKGLSLDTPITEENVDLDIFVNNISNAVFIADNALGTTVMDYIKLELKSIDENPESLNMDDSVDPLDERTVSDDSTPLKLTKSLPTFPKLMQSVLEEKPASHEITDTITKATETCHRVLNTKDTPLMVPGDSVKYEKIKTDTKFNKQYSCDVCKKSFNLKSTLVTHISMHTGDKRFSCSLCHKSYKKASTFLKHKRIHSIKKPYSCDLCEKSFNVQSRLLSHMRKHAGDRPFPCSFCQKSYTKLQHLQIHVRTHTGERPYSCIVCKKAFTGISQLANHKRIHSGIRPYSCSLCKKSFKRSCYMKLHLRSHTGEKPYSCEVCMKEFSVKCNLVCHMRIHTGDKMMYRCICDVCGKTFSTKPKLFNHIMTIHSGE